jgi:predicted SprT family Zn-dependent metalloprotease
MNLQQAKKLAIEQMDKHGLLDLGWSFEYDNAKRRFGVCKYRPKVIGLSMLLVAANDEHQVLDTILHEIAHAIAGFAAGHGPEWKRVCVRIGAKPERCYSSKDTNTIAGKYKAVCGGCGMTHTRHKRPMQGRRTACLCQNSIKDWNKKKLLEYKRVAA